MFRNNGINAVYLPFRVPRGELLPLIQQFEAVPVKGQYAGIHDWRTDGMLLVGSQSGMSTLKLGARSVQ